MKKIAIVGAGQSGLQLGLSLLQSGHQVTLISDRSAEQIQQGKVMSSQVLFHRSLETERKLGLNHWESQCPVIEGISFALVHEQQTVLSFAANLDGFAQSVDQRIKLAAWLNEFADKGGKLFIQSPSVSMLEQLAQTHDLVIVASGKGEMSQLFEVDAERSPYQTPQRILALAYLRTEFPLRNPIVFFEGVPFGPLDCWADIKTPEQHLQKTIELLEQYFPSEADKYKNAELTDSQATLTGKFAPVVRKPVAVLPSGALVLGMADTLVLNDPITGQGANNAAKCSAIYTKSIVENEGPFDADWMQQTFDIFWDYAQWVTAWTNGMLQQPLPLHIQHLLGAASQITGVAEAFVNGFDNPPDFFPWIANPAESEKFIAAGGRKSGAQQPILS
jgi:hypothetical protein